MDMALEEMDDWYKAKPMIIFLIVLTFAFLSAWIWMPLGEGWLSAMAYSIALSITSGIALLFLFFAALFYYISTPICAEKVNGRWLLKKDNRYELIRKDGRWAYEFHRDDAEEPKGAAVNSGRPTPPLSKPKVSSSSRPHPSLRKRLYDRTIMGRGLMWAHKGTRRFLIKRDD